MDVAAYLARIAYDGPTSPTDETLRALHVAHLRAVPFENLDLHLGRPISLELPDLFEKVVVKRRGGFCYELNGLFAWLLEELGFGVERFSARVLGERGLGPEFDHLALRVTAEESWFVDVGFGDSFLEPLPWEPGVETLEGARVHRFVADGPHLWLERREEVDWERQFRFEPVDRRLDEFLGTCRWQETSPDSHFLERAICSRATPEGRTSVAGARLIRIVDGDRTEAPIRDVEALREVLAGEFGVTFGPGVDLRPLLGASTR